MEIPSVKSAGPCNVCHRHLYGVHVEGYGEVWTHLEKDPRTGTIWVQLTCNNEERERVMGWRFRDSAGS